MKRSTHGTRIAVVLLLVWGVTGTVGAAESVSVLSGSTVSNPRQPQVAVSDEGTIYVAFGSGDSVYCSASTDGGASYGDSVKLGAVDRLALGMRRGPRIAVGGEGVVVTAVSHESGNVLAWQSTDRGRTWTGPTSVNDSAPGTANEGLHALAAAPNGDLYCVWLDHRLARKNHIFGAASSDGGKSWSENKLIYRSPGGSVCECCHPAVTFDSQGKLYVMWRNSLEGFRDMYVASSGDGGKTFGEASKLGFGSWKLDACPMDGGYLAANVSGGVTTVWRREKQVFAADAKGGERLLATGEQPWAAGSSKGAWIVWVSRRGGDLWLASPGMELEPVKLAGNATDPAIAAPAGGEGPVVVVWESKRGNDARIMASVVDD